MGKVKVAGFSVSVDGFGAGPEQSLQDPLGKRGPEVHQWIFGTRYFHEMTGKEGGDTDSVDQAYAQRAMAGFGAFSPQLGRWLLRTPAKSGQGPTHPPNRPPVVV